MKETFLIDVPVAIIFFARPEQTQQIFNVIKEVRPSKLFLVQDGAREGNNDDVLKILECKKIFENITWECEVYKNYSDTNLGCGKRVATGMQWVFNYVDRIIRIEDDVVPSISWFYFCAELLEKYKDDQRIAAIAGVNQLGVYKGMEFDYFFSTTGSVWAFATWKRVWDNFDYEVSFLENKYYIKMVKKNIYPRYIKVRISKKIKDLIYMKENSIKRTSWSGPFGFMLILNSQLFIVPRVNMATNIGAVKGATNGDGTLNATPKRLQSIFFAKRHDLEFPIKHPKYVIDDKIYTELVNRILNGGKNPVRRLVFLVEKAIRILMVRYLKVLK